MPMNWKERPNMLLIPSRLQTKTLTTQIRLLVDARNGRDTSIDTSKGSNYMARKFDLTFPSGSTNSF